MRRERLGPLGTRTARSRARTWRGHFNHTLVHDAQVSVLPVCIEGGETRRVCAYRWGCQTPTMSTSLYMHMHMYMYMYLCVGGGARNRL